MLLHPREHLTEQQTPKVSDALPPFCFAVFIQFLFDFFPSSPRHGSRHSRLTQARRSRGNSCRRRRLTQNRRVQEIVAAVRGSPRPAIHGRSRRRSRLTQDRRSREITPPFAAHPDPPFAGDGSAARGDDDAAVCGDDDAAGRDDEGSVARGDDDDAAARGSPRPA